MSPEPSPPGDSGAWERALEEAEEVVERLRAGLEGRVALEGVEPVTFPSEPIPASLAPRARLLLRTHADLEVALRERVAILGAAMHRDPSASRAAIALYLDRSL